MRRKFSCPKDVNEAAYKGLVGPVLEYEAQSGIPIPQAFRKN